ncbi:FxSxx-COOH cyclophane-containing RiPP peptide [Sphaerisporangium sp. B11E5]|uniref:FxSxx-COOH cyclophane-containing RiPP peptide n=1 Tax=Sphaerisporangium sp. B11E5 TaxID=3153563 RepID=UPI00325E2C8F
MDDGLTETCRLIDVTGITLEDLDKIESAPLLRALHRLLEVDEDEMGPIAGFNQSIDSPNGI